MKTKIYLTIFTCCLVWTVGKAQLYTPNGTVERSSGYYYNVGIGVAEPLYTLDVNGDIHAQFYKIGSTSSARLSSSLAIKRRGGDDWLQLQMSGRDNYFGFNTPDGENSLDLTWATYAGAINTLISIKDNGMVGIGTTRPNSLLTVGNGQGTALSVGVPDNDYWASTIIIRTFWEDGIGDYTDIKVPGRPDHSSSFIRLRGNGNVGIGCQNPTVRLAVDGKIQATEVEIKTAPCSDYVFEKNYKLLSLPDLEKFVISSKHLPEVPSAKEFAEKGYNMGQMDDLLLKKVEELTLYLIEQNKKIELLQQENIILKDLMNKTK